MENIQEVNVSERLEKGTAVAGQLMQYKEEHSKITGMRETIQEYINHASYGADLENVIKNIEELGDNRASIIKFMTFDEIKELYVDPEGNQIVLNINGTEKEKCDFYKDFALYLFDSKAQEANIQLTLDQFDQEIDKLMKELNEAVGAIGDMPTLMETNMKNIIEECKEPTRKKLAIMGLKAMEDAWNLETIVKHYNKIGTQNVLKEYSSRNGQKRISEKFSVFLKKTGLHSTMVNFPEIESRYLEEKYHIYPNLFIFMIVKYFGANASDSESMNNKLLLTQLITILTSLYGDNLLPENKERILQSVRNVLDLIIK